MRILFVANTLPPRDLSGVGEQVMQLAAGLRRRGHEVEVLGRAESGVAASKLLFPLTVLPRLRRRLDGLRPEVVQVHESDGAWAAMAVDRWRDPDAAVALLGLLQVSYREEFRSVRPLRGVGALPARPGFDELRFRWLRAPIHMLLGRSVARRCDLVLAPSRQTATELQRDYGVRRCAVLPNVVGGVRRDPEPVPGLPAEFVLFVGRLRIRKGIEVLLEAMRQLHAGDLEVPLVVAGDGERLTTLRRRVDRLGLRRRVQFLGRCSPEEVQALLGAARALVVPSIYEGMPLVVLEAMEAGTPVIASAVSGIPEVVVGGESGWLVPPEDPGSLASTLREVWLDPEEAARRAAAAGRRLDRHYRPARAAERWEELVRGLRANGDA